MREIQETNKINVRYEYDVCITGGGIAGVAAACAAARSGAKTILIEKGWMLGGLGTAGLVTIYLPICDGMGNQVSFGLAEELLRLSVKYGHEGTLPKHWFEEENSENKKMRANGSRFMTQYNPQLYAILLEQLLVNEGVKILYGTSVCSAVKSENKITELIIESKSGREAISAKSFVDASGDADICHFTGEKTATFAQGNVLAAWYYSLGSEYTLNQLGFCDVPDEHKSAANNENFLSKRRFCGLDGEELSDMTIMSHEKILEDVLKKENTVPITIPTTPQIRMTRRLAGLYTMSESDDGKLFDDSVGTFSNWKVRGPVYHLPFAALIGGTVDNLICAGRCISANDTMWDVTRVIPVCAVSGEAAGTAAAMSCNFQKIDIKKLQNELKRKGVKI